MKMKLFIRITSSLIALIFVYASFSKIFDFYNYQQAMVNQPLPHWLSILLIWTIPPLEIATAICILTDRFLFIGFLSSTILFASFTAYVVAILINYFGFIPCACGGAIKYLLWKGHLIINILFLSLSALGTVLIYRNKRNFTREIKLYSGA